MKIISIREHPEYSQMAIDYFQEQWATEDSKLVYEDAILHVDGHPLRLPQWYLLFHEDEIVGCAGLISNDFISRMDLCPWLCALYIDPAWRRKNLPRKLINYIQQDANALGWENIYLCTDHVEFYEKMGFEYIGNGYHPWGEVSRLYTRKYKDLSIE